MKCKLCGGDIRAEDGAAFGMCDFCGVTSTLPKASDEKMANLFNRANHFRQLNEFDKALSSYENILNEDNTNAEAHWCVVLCRYGIDYVEDPRTHERVPTCHRVQYESILTDADYLAALEYAEDDYVRSLYAEEAKKISDIQKSILAISNSMEHFDVFICYKESTDGGSRSKDSVLAQDIYYQLTNEGYKVFFSRITLEDKLGHEYEPYIFAALNSAKVMLVIGTCKEHFEAAWVRNEWSRFLSLMKADRSKLMIPCYQNMNAYDLPDELAVLQSQDMSKIGFAQDLSHGVKKVLDAGQNIAAKQTDTNMASQSAPLLRRAFLMLEDYDWERADDLLEQVLNLDPENSRAYLGKLCVACKVTNEKDLARMPITLSDMPHYKKAIRFADADLRSQLEKYNQSAIEFKKMAEEQRRTAEEHRQEAYHKLKRRREELDQEKLGALENRKKFGYPRKDSAITLFIAGLIVALLGVLLGLSLGKWVFGEWFWIVIIAAFILAGYYINVAMGHIQFLTPSKVREREEADMRLKQIEDEIKRIEDEIIRGQ